MGIIKVDPLFVPKTQNFRSPTYTSLGVLFPRAPWERGGWDSSLMSDNGTQPTSVAFMRACGVLGIQQAFTSYSNPKGNADTERVMRTLKEELIHIRE